MAGPHRREALRQLKADLLGVIAKIDKELDEADVIDVEPSGPRPALPEPAAVTESRNDGLDTDMNAYLQSRPEDVVIEQDVFVDVEEGDEDLELKARAERERDQRVREQLRVLRKMGRPL